MDVEVRLLRELGAGGRRGAHQRHGARGHHRERSPHHDSLLTVRRTARRQAARPWRLARHWRWTIFTAWRMQDFRALPDSTARQLRIAAASWLTLLAGCALPTGAAVELLAGRRTRDVADHVDRVDHRVIGRDAARDQVALAVARADLVGAADARHQRRAADRVLAVDVVLARAAVDEVVAVAAGDGVRPRPSEHGVVPHRAVERVVAGPAVDRVVAVGADEHVGAVVAGHRVAGLAAVDLFDVVGDQVVLAGRAVIRLTVERDRQRIGPLSVADGVRVGAAAQLVRARGVVGAGLLHDRVAAGLVLEHVVARPRVQHVVAGATDEVVTAVAAGQPVVAAVAEQRVVAGAAVDRRRAIPVQRCVISIAEVHDDLVGLGADDRGVVEATLFAAGGRRDRVRVARPTGTAWAGCRSRCWRRRARSSARRARRRRSARRRCSSRSRRRPRRGSRAR